MPTFGSFFSGGGLADVGAKAAGYTLVFANEIDPAMAEVYRRNLGNHIIVGNILDLDIDSLPYVDLFHASPVCTNASIANNKRGEKELDILTARKTCEYIRKKRPAKVTIENVSQYRYFRAYREIIECLDECGYWHNAEILHAEDFGVPQSRHRLVVRAVLGGFVPYLPEPVRHIGWYESILDLIPTLPDDKFADWQLARLPEELRTALFTNGKFGENLVFAEKDDPANAITANENQGYLRSFIINDNRTSLEWKSKNDIISTELLYATISATNHSIRAFIVGGGAEPGAAYDVCGTPNDEGQSVTIRDETDPIFTITSSIKKRPNRAWLSSGRVVRMTPRALARFQSVPDWYELPASNGLAGKIIGNGLPCLMYRRIAESLKEETHD